MPATATRFTLGFQVQDLGARKVTFNLVEVYMALRQLKPYLTPLSRSLSLSLSLARSLGFRDCSGLCVCCLGPLATQHNYLNYWAHLVGPYTSFKIEERFLTWELELTDRSAGLEQRPRRRERPVDGRDPCPQRRQGLC